MAALAPNQALGLELRALVRVAEGLAHLEVVLGEHAVVSARDVSRGDVREPAQSAAPPRQVGKVQHAARALDVDLPRLLQREREGHRRGRVDDVCIFGSGQGAGRAELRDVARADQDVVGLVYLVPGVQDVRAADEELGWGPRATEQP